MSVLTRFPLGGTTTFMLQEVATMTANSSAKSVFIIGELNDVSNQTDRQQTD